MAYDYIDLVLGICLVLLVVGYIFGATSFTDAGYFAGLLIAKKSPQFLGNK